MDTTDLPPISKALIDALEKAFPAKDFTPSTPLRELDFYYGQRAVVNLLKHVREVQNENLLTNKD